MAPFQGRPRGREAGPKSADFARLHPQEHGFQFIVISLKDNFYEKANGLVGVFRDRKIEASRTVTLDLDAISQQEPEDDEE